MPAPVATGLVDVFGADHDYRIGQGRGQPADETLGERGRLTAEAASSEATLDARGGLLDPHGSLERIPPEVQVEACDHDTTNPDRKLEQSINGPCIEQVNLVEDDRLGTGRCSPEGLR
jgi:hypothetical protein